MNIGKIGSISNFGGVVNLGVIHGDVVNTIKSSLGAAPGMDHRELREHLLQLADLVAQNSAQIAESADTLRRIQNLAQEVSTVSPDKTLIERAIARIAAATAGVMPVIDSLAKIRNLLEPFLKS